ncbi:MAG: hypothetical protein CMJ83_19645 [Planctomycetes bacterium]|jgi:hypothetical protein|nr:hypothetical protein [Planctomycetota bacterium]
MGCRTFRPAGYGRRTAALFDRRSHREGASIGGYFVLRARDYDEALQLVGDCPHLAEGGWIELRRIEGT